MSAYKKYDRILTLMNIKNKRELNPHDIRKIIEILEDHEARIAALEDEDRLTKKIEEIVKEYVREYA